MEALNLTTGKVEWDTKVPQFPLGAATVSNDLVFTTLYDGVLIALNRSTGAIVYRRQLPTSTNSPIAIAGNTVIVPAGGPVTEGRRRPADRGIQVAVGALCAAPLGNTGGGLGSAAGDGPFDLYKTSQSPPPRSRNWDISIHRMLMSPKLIRPGGLWDFCMSVGHTVTPSSRRTTPFLNRRSSKS